MGSVLTELLREAEMELASVRGQRADLERAERLASERVSHLRALVELENGASEPDDSPNDTAQQELPDVVLRQRRKLGAVGATTSSDQRPEDIAAVVIEEKGPLHYRDLWDEVAQRGGVIVSGNPAAVLLTRISRDERFAKDKGRGVYKLALGEGPAGARPKRRKHKGRRRAKRTTGAVPE